MEVAPKKDMPPMPPMPPQQSTVGAGAGAGIIIAGIVGAIVTFIFHYGAARLSYNTYGSYGWSFLAFIFAVFYYPYYAFFVSKPATLLGGKRR